MIIAHLPAGYILSSLLSPLFEGYAVTRQRFIQAGLVGAIAPDLDMIYFYWIDHRAHPHHSYFSHFPSVWLVLLGVAWLSLRCASRKQLPALATILTLNGMLHMCLDFISTNIYWFAPWINKPFSLFDVSRRYDIWWLNFLTHRSFGLEIAIIAAAVYFWHKYRRSQRFTANRIGGSLPR